MAKVYRHLTAFLILSMLAISACWGDETRIDPRTAITLTDGWRFNFGSEEHESIILPAYDDSGWEPVTVPHSWNRVGYYNNDLVVHDHTPDNVDQRQGIGWYRLKFAAPQSSGPVRHWLEFDAASRTAQVWLNGQYLGEHRGGFTRFRLDATEALQAGTDNTLVVKTDNSKPKADSATFDTLPIAGDFFVHGGLYRPVRLISTAPVHIDMQDFGGPGVYATSRLGADGSADVSLRSRVANQSPAETTVNVTAMLLDHQGQTVASHSRPIDIAPGATEQVAQALSVPHARRWQGVTDPYLYTLRLELRSEAGALLDALDQSFGLREVSLDAERGFFLNGERLDLHGVAYHQDREGRGWAVSVDDIAEDVSILRDMGANTIRLAHYPHGKPVHDLADKYGIILWAEIPLVSLWTYGREHVAQNQALADNARLQLVEMIRQYFNHPSVAVWGVANEVDFGKLLPVFLGTDPDHVPDPIPLLKDLVALAQAEDGSRQTTLANCCERLESMRDKGIPSTTGVADSAGLNRYFGWYYGEAAELGPHLDELHARLPSSPLSISEYGAGGAVSLHTDNPLGGPVDARGRAQPEAYMAMVHEENWRIIEQRPYLWASWVWNGFDFATTVRREGDAIDINTKGLVTYDRQIRKDPFYFYRANWSMTPTVHITGRRYVQRAYATTDVRVYSNAPTTELLVNGQSFGSRSECPQQVCVWHSVRLQEGTNAVTARGAFTDGAQEDTVEWHVDPALRDAYRIDSGALMAADGGQRRFGSDHFFSGGRAASIDTPGGWGERPVRPDIARTALRDLYASYREGEFGYRLPVENGRYRVRLLFIEPSLAPGERVFDVLANGELLLGALDIAQSAGAPRSALEHEFIVEINTGALELDFRPQVAGAVVSAIEVEKLQ